MGFPALNTITAIQANNCLPPLRREDCGYVARCSAPECRRRATTILRYLDSQGRPDHQIEACDDHANELSAELNVIDRRH
jgi:hypothetical protein